MGLTSLVTHCVQVDLPLDSLQDMLGESLDHYATRLIRECMFDPVSPHKLRFKSPSLRKLGFDLLHQLKLEAVSRSLSERIVETMRAGGSWRQPDEWSIAVMKHEQHTFCGLKNLAATCYINSLLQQLFFIDDFRNQLINLDAEAIEDPENIALEVQSIFAHLKFSEIPVQNTSSLCKKFIMDGQPIDPRIQMDVDEFFHSLMDKLERNLGKVGHKEMINNIFGGEQSNLIVGTDCEHTSERVEPFLSIRLDIKDKSSLEEALHEYIKG